MPEGVPVSGRRAGKHDHWSLYRQGLAPRAEALLSLRPVGEGPPDGDRPNTQRECLGEAARVAHGLPAVARNGGVGVGGMIGFESLAGQVSPPALGCGAHIRFHRPPIRPIHRDRT